eukprot:3115390-Rhodomonas_salina.1
MAGWSAAPRTPKQQSAWASGKTSPPTLACPRARTLTARPCGRSTPQAARRSTGTGRRRGAARASASSSRGPPPTPSSTT